MGARRRSQEVMMQNPDSKVPETGDGRAQPGDIIGIETDGERTYLGDTREDEDKRREAAEDEAKANPPKLPVNR